MQKDWVYTALLLYGSGYLMTLSAPRLYSLAIIMATMYELVSCVPGGSDGRLGGGGRFIRT
jgi:hypothetical protein